MKRFLFLVATGLLCSCATAFSSVVTVDTVDNDSTGADGRTSLLEALRSVRPGDTIAFNIPGPGPHQIVTPLGGYPLIRGDGITLDGYTQPGSAPNSRPFDGTNNADIRIVLDSRGDENAGSPFQDRPGLILRRSTRMVFEDGTVDPSKN